MLFIATEDLLRFTATKILFTRVNVAQAENLRVNPFIEYSNSRINATRYRSYANFLVLLGVLVNQASWSVLLSVEIIIKIILFYLFIYLSIYLLVAPNCLKNPPGNLN